jgi:xylulokinase
VATHLVGIDLGTSGVRITAYDTDGEVLLSSEAAIDVQTVDRWERALRGTALFLPGGRVLCTADGTSGTAVLVDEYGEPVFDPQMYYDSAPKQGRAVAALDATADIERKGVPVSATSPIAKLLRLREDSPEEFAAVEWILSPTTWLLYRLSIPEGEPWREVETDWTNALKFGADVTAAAPEWYEPLFESVDLSLDLFPSIVAPGTPVGTAESTLAADIGLGGAELYQGMTDGNASAMSAGCLEPGDYSIACESTSVVKYVAESITPHEALYYHRHPIAGYTASAAFETGVVFRWFCDRLFAMDERRGLEAARRVPPGAEYDVYLQGNRSPFFESGMANSVFGLWPDGDVDREGVRGRLLRGVVTEITLAEYGYLPLVAEVFDAGIERVSLLSHGTPGGDDPFSWWNELRASIWDRSVTQMEPRTTVGSLLPATLAASVYDDAETAAERLLRASGTVSPDASVAETYAPHRHEHAERWADVRALYSSWDE